MNLDVLQETTPFTLALVTISHSVVHLEVRLKSTSCSSHQRRRLTHQTKTTSPSKPQDWIYGDEGQDIILGDFGLYNATQQFLRNQYFKSIISSPQWAGDDHIYGGEDDDFIMGQEGSDFIDGGSGADDITGGHNKRHGHE